MRPRRRVRRRAVPERTPADQADQLGRRQAVPLDAEEREQCPFQRCRPVRADVAPPPRSTPGTGAPRPAQSCSDRRARRVAPERTAMPAMPATAAPCTVPTPQNRQPPPFGAASGPGRSVRARSSAPYPVRSACRCTAFRCAQRHAAHVAGFASAAMIGENRASQRARPPGTVRCSIRAYTSPAAGSRVARRIRAGGLTSRGQRHLP